MNTNNLIHDEKDYLDIEDPVVVPRVKHSIQGRIIKSQINCVTNRSFLFSGQERTIEVHRMCSPKLTLWDRFRLWFDVKCPAFSNYLFPFKYDSFKLTK